MKIFKRMKLGLQHRLELRKLQKQRDEKLREMKQQKQFEINKTNLEREVELEKLKADVRKEQARSQPKPGTKQEKKSKFAAFQDYCDNFTKSQPNIVGDLNFGGVNGTGKRKKGSTGGWSGIGPSF